MTLRLATITIATLLATACSSVPPALPIGATPAPNSFTATLTLHGEISLQGRFADTLTLRNETCEQYVAAAAPATTLWVVPTPTDAESIDGHIVTYTAGVPDAAPSRGYHGPGTYDGASAVVTVLTVDNASFVGGDSASTSISVNSAGAGVMTFTGLVDTNTNALESGQVQWICTN